MYFNCSPLFADMSVWYCGHAVVGGRLQTAPEPGAGPERAAREPAHLYDPGQPGREARRHRRAAGQWGEGLSLRHSVMLWWYCYAMVVLLCYGGIVIPWWYCYSMVGMLCYGGIVMLWWDCFAMEGLLCYGGVVIKLYGGIFAMLWWDCYAMVVLLGYGGFVILLWDC